MGKRASAVVAARRTRVVRRRASLKKRVKTFLALLALLLLSAVAIALIAFVVIFVQVSRALPSLAEIGNFKPSEGTRIYYKDGALMAVLATENRVPVKLEAISKHLIDATIACEDKRFYEHTGVDIYGVARAIYRNLTGGDLTAQGASTITQQLARNISELGLTREKILRRKVAEAILAMKMEQYYTKDEILELYLNQIYYGNGAYGAEAAARAYFHKSAKELTVGEAAMLAGIPQRPSLYAENAEAAYRRRDWVLDRMVETGKITPQERDRARAQRLTMYRAEPRGNRILSAPYFVNYVVRQLIHGTEEKPGFGPDFVYSGLQIYTTLDSRIQSAAEQVLREGIRKYGRSTNQGALICLDPRTGYIRAMVGGVDYKRDQYNIVIQGHRQPGSSFKPIVYTAAIDTGVCTLNKYYHDDPYFKGMRAGNTWFPKNYGGKRYGTVSVLTAIKRSINTIAVKVAMETGLRTVVDYAHRLGITTDIDLYPTLALGASAVRPIDLCSAYSVFANGGKRALPMSILRVVDTKGEVVTENGVQIVDTGLKPETVAAMNLALQEVVLHGTGTAAAKVPNAHGKTGTTNDNRDSWFAGYTPELTTVIWVGNEQRNRKGKVVKYLTMPGATGGAVCAPIWRDFMLKAVPIQQAADKAAGGSLSARVERPKPVEEKKPPKESPKPEGADAIQDTTGPDEATTPPALAPDETPPATTAPGPELIPTPPGPGALANPPSFPSAAPSPVPAVRSTALIGGRESTGRLATPTLPRTDPRDEVVTVRLCADSMRRATRWCDATIERRMRRRDLPGRCRTHRPPPGEE